MKTSKEKAVVYTGTRNLYPAMMPAVKSLLMNANIDKVYLLIEDDVFPYSLPKEVECINVSGQDIFKPDGPNMTSHFTYMALMRAALFKLFPEHDRMLALDVDTIVHRDISNLWDLEGFEDCYFAASTEPGRCRTGYIYTNIGVTMYNLEKLRDGKGDEVIEALNKRRYIYMEQDAFNEMCQGHILDLDSCYNVNDFTAPCRGKVAILHFAGMRQWMDERVVKLYDRVTFDDIYRYRRRMGWSVATDEEQQQGTVARKMFDRRLTNEDIS